MIVTLSDPQPAIRLQAGALPEIMRPDRGKSRAYRPTVDAASWVSALLPLAAGGWIGTAGELLELLPAGLRPSHANKLAGHFHAVEPDLRAAGISVATLREGGTGRRLLSLAAPAQNCGTERNLAAASHSKPAKHQAAINAGAGANTKTAGTDLASSSHTGPSDVTIGVRLCHPRTWFGDPCRPEPGVRCKVCRGGRFWSSDGLVTWHCVGCWPAPVVFPGQPPHAWATT